MTKKSRTILFIICIFLFVLATPSVVLYSQGYRFDFEKKQVVQTGNFYFKVLPNKAEIYLNGRFKKRTSMFTNSALIENLLPKIYEIEIKKEGYHSWGKTLEVKEKEVTEAKNIILFPKNPNFIITEQKLPEIKISATSTDKRKLVEFNNYEIWISYIGKEKEEVFLTRFSEKIGKVLWLNNYYLIFNVGDKIKVAEIDDRDKLNMVDLVEFKNPEIFWSEPEKKLYVSSKGKLYVSENLLP